MTVVVDTGPLLAAANRRDEAHGLAAALLIRLGRNAVIPGPVLVETDHLMRRRLGIETARALLSAVADGRHRAALMTMALVRRAVRIDVHYADLDLGYADAAVMAVAERLDAPILTFDFRDFRGAPPLGGGSWPLIVDEARYRDGVGH